MGEFQHHLVYLSYGEGPHVLETQYSVLSALRFTLSDPAGVRISIFTDHPGHYAHLPVVVETISPVQLAAWAGPHCHEHRRKPAMMQFALQRDGVPTIAVDSDTYFLRHPVHAFRELAPGHSVMHLCEGKLREHPNWRFFVDLAVRDRIGNDWKFSAGTRMWNGGVEGLHPADAGVMEEVFALMDAVYTERLWIAEQFSTSNVFAKRTRIHETCDTVFHYWADRYRIPFRAVLQEILPGIASLPLAEQISICYRYRPRPTWGRVLKKKAIAVLEQTGYLRQGWRPRISG